MWRRIKRSNQMNALNLKPLHSGKRVERRDKRCRLAWRRRQSRDLGDLSGDLGGDLSGDVLVLVLVPWMRPCEWQKRSAVQISNARRNRTESAGRGEAARNFRKSPCDACSITMPSSPLSRGRSLHRASVWTM